ncbi:MAG: M23 family metallopeptidase [Eubacteriales bacterium]|nr:M23 family metallopeptidase [Eubacteriales bacterium]
MRRRKAGGAYRREKAIMIASAVLVLAAMTVTGVYVYHQKQPEKPQDNVVDFSVLEPETGEEVAEAENRSAKNRTSGEGDSGELDYDPYYVEKDKSLSSLPTLQDAEGQDSQEQTAAAETEAAPYNVGYAEYGSGGVPAGGEGLAADGSLDGQEDETGTDAEGGEEDALAAVADVTVEEERLRFGEDSALSWPIAGNVLLNYSMDKTIYFPTLQQYKYNPSIVISAAQGTGVACAADGVVEAVYEDAQTGISVRMRLGNGYELTYGQLQEVTVEEGDYVEAGAFIGKVAAPTKYYAAEGTNVYFKLTKDGAPVNPLDYLG